MDLVNVERAAAVASVAAIVLGAGVLVAIALDVRSRRIQPATTVTPFPISPRPWRSA